MMVLFCFGNMSKVKIEGPLTSKMGDIIILRGNFKLGVSLPHNSLLRT